jgi:hypothetical protein
MSEPHEALLTSTPSPEPRRKRGRKPYPPPSASLVQCLAALERLTPPERTRLLRILAAAYSEEP